MSWARSCHILIIEFSALHFVIRQRNINSNFEAISGQLIKDKHLTREREREREEGERGREGERERARERERDGREREGENVRMSAFHAHVHMDRILTKENRCESQQTLTDDTKSHRTQVQP